MDGSGGTQAQCIIYIHIKRVDFVFISKGV